MKVIELRDLTKDFQIGFFRKKPFRALDHLCLEVEEGEIFGFLGPNGAGKTTTLKILMRLLYPTSGSAWILERPISDVSVHARIGYLPESPYFYDYLTGEEFLSYCGRIFGFGPREVRRRTADLLDAVGIGDARLLPLRKYSKGMLQRIGVAQALINDPRVLFLDEPMSGLDPLGRREVREIILQQRQRGVTVFFSSHILPDVESLCDRVAILNRGRLVDCGKLTDILRMEITSLELVATNVAPPQSTQLERLALQANRLGERLHLRMADDGVVEQSLRLIREGKGKLISINPVRESLEDYFLKAMDQSDARDPGQGGTEKREAGS
ncbi:MAG: ABC transporter ATP-binding protein [Acidobacteria bacterium]|nr:ABC transporter ATP-binding protein [Acidobacteriota bacterium]